MEIIFCGGVYLRQKQAWAASVEFARRRCANYALSGRNHLSECHEGVDGIKKPQSEDCGFLNVR